MTAGVVFVQAASLTFSALSSTWATSHRRTVLIGDDEAAVLRRALQLVVGVDRVGARGAVEIAFRRVDVGGADGGAQIVEVEAVGGEGARVGLDAHRRTLAAADADEADARKLRDL